MTPPTCRLAIFDLDGTVLDTLEDLADSLNHALALHGCPTRTLAEVRSFVGDGIRLLVERAVPEGCGITDSVFADFKAHYAQHCTDKTRPYDGILPLLHALRERGIATAVVSNKADFAVQTLCSRYFPGLFHLCVGEKAGIRRKPAPDSVNRVLAALSIPAEDAVYIGDSEVDIRTGENARLRCISVTWGFRDAPLLLEQGAQTLAHTPGQLLALL